MSEVNFFPDPLLNRQLKELNMGNKKYVIFVKKIIERNMQELQIWITYHDDRQIEEYGLKEDDVYRLFKGNASNVDGENINHLNAFYSE